MGNKHFITLCGSRTHSCRKERILRLGILTASLAAVFALRPVQSWAEETVTSGVYVDDIDVSGMTRSQLKKTINERVSQLGQTQANLVIQDQTMTVTLNDLGLEWGNTQIIDEIMNLGSTGNIIQRYKDQKDLEKSNKKYDLTFSVDEDIARTVAKSCCAYNTEPVEAELYTQSDLTPGITGGVDGITVDVDGASDAIISALNTWDGQSAITVDIPVTLEAPDVTYDDLSIVCDVLGQATTDYSASSWERATNVENGCSKITGTLLYPGDYFSVTDAVTPFTAENGYEQAPSYEENRVVDSYGGGICQVSTTLYNAVLKAELEVTARSNHSMAVSYVDLSKDAAIAEGYLDFAFVNNLDDPVYIVGYTYGGEISFIIYGHETRPANRSIEFVSETISTIEPTEARLYADTEQSVGYIEETQSPHTGYTAELWKNIYYDGVLTDTVQVNTSYYDAVGTIYDIGVASSSTALTEAMYNAISSGSLSQVQSVIASAYSYMYSYSSSGTTSSSSYGTTTTG